MFWPYCHACTCTRSKSEESRVALELTFFWSHNAACHRVQCGICCLWTTGFILFHPFKHRFQTIYLSKILLFINNFIKSVVNFVLIEPLPMPKMRTEAPTKLTLPVVMFIHFSNVLLEKGLVHLNKTNVVVNAEDGRVTEEQVVEHA